MPYQTCRKRCFSSPHLFRQEAQLSLTNQHRAMLVCKVVEVWQDLLSEYVDKKFTYVCYRQLIRHEWIYYGSQKLRNLQQLKNRRFHIPQPTFLFPLETPLRLSRNVLHEWKDNPMLAKPLAASIFNNFRVILCLSQCVSPIIAIFTTFLFPLGTPRGQSR